jgi:murein DD-endopeptidase MepM/ murein hydrolase activator NlpD/Flp pilus assembly protein TadD
MISTGIPHKVVLLLSLSLPMMVGACTTSGLSDLTASITSPNTVLPSTDEGWRRYTEEWGRRFEANPGDKTSALNYASGLRARTEYAQAVAVLQQAVIKHLTDLEILGAYGKALADDDRLDEAADVLSRAHTPEHPNWSILSAQGVVADKMGDHAAAQAYYQAALKIVPGEPSVLSNLGLSYTLDKQLDLGEQTMRQAVASPRADARVRQNLALVLALEGKFADAETLEKHDLSPADAAANVAQIRQMIAQSNTRRNVQTRQNTLAVAAAPTDVAAGAKLSSMPLPNPVSDAGAAAAPPAARANSLQPPQDDGMFLQPKHVRTVAVYAGGTLAEPANMTADGAQAAPVPGLTPGLVVAAQTPQTTLSAAPIFRRTAKITGDANASRGDLLTSARDRNDVGSTPARIEQLSDSGLSIGTFTHVTARLGQSTDVTTASAALSQEDDPGTASAISTQARAATPSLPREILFGKSWPVLPTNTRAYAALDDAESRAIAPMLGESINVTAAPKAPPQHDLQRVVVAGAGDKLPLILRALTITPDDAQEIASLLAGQKWFGDATFSGGEKITVLKGASDDDPAAIRPLKVSIERTGEPIAAVAFSDAGHYLQVASNAAGADGSPLRDSGGDMDLRLSSDESLRESLHAVAQANRIDRSLIDELVRLCAHDVDLEAPVSAADSVDFLYSANDLGQPELAFVGLTADGRTQRYYRFTAPDDGSTDYYDANGHSVTEFLLRKPVAEGRLGDAFGWRMHPILRDWRFHKGVDYPAPFGSPIAAAGAGVVEKIDQQWGYGKYIRIRHSLGYETTYAHVSSFPPGLKVGDRVRQGQPIAYVGSTGLSTGPHLYYEVRINGHDVDPLRVRLAAGRVLDGATLATFERLRDRTDLLLAASAAPGSRH